jgi:hypothetical protein
MDSLRTWFTDSIAGQAETDTDPVPYDVGEGARPR